MFVYVMDCISQMNPAEKKCLYVIILVLLEIGRCPSTVLGVVFERAFI